MPLTATHRAYEHIVLEGKCGSVELKYLSLTIDETLDLYRELHDALLKAGVLAVPSP